MQWSFWQQLFRLLLWSPEWQLHWRSKRNSFEWAGLPRLCGTSKSGLSRPWTGPRVDRGQVWQEGAFRDAAWLILLTCSLFFCPRSVCPESLFFQSLEEEQKPKHSPDSTLEVVPVTPDVDLLLQCSFSYMHQGAECESQEQKPEEEVKEEVGFSFCVSFLNAVSFSTCDGAGPLSTCSLLWQPLTRRKSPVIPVKTLVCCFYVIYFSFCHDCEQIMKSLWAPWAQWL